MVSEVNKESRVDVVVSAISKEKKNQETENEILFVEELVEFSPKFIEKEKYTGGKEEKEIAEEGENMTDGNGDGRKDGSAAEKTRW